MSFHAAAINNIFVMIYWVMCDPTFGIAFRFFRLRMDWNRERKEASVSRLLRKTPKPISREASSKVHSL